MTRSGKSLRPKTKSFNQTGGGWGGPHEMGTHDTSELRGNKNETSENETGSGRRKVHQPKTVTTTSTQARNASPPRSNASRDRDRLALTLPRRHSERPSEEVTVKKETCKSNTEACHPDPFIKSLPHLTGAGRFDGITAASASAEALGSAT